MNRRDRLSVAALLLSFAVVATAIVVPAYLPAEAAREPTPTAIGSRMYVEGVVGRATSVNPLTARNQAERDLVALVFSGLVRLGPGDTVIGDLASRWRVDPEGRIWTFELRRDAVWQDGVPVTADDVAFTVGLLQDPDYTGPAAPSWRDVSVRVVGERTVVFELANPLAGFLRAATQPIVPSHLLRGIPVDELPTSELGSRPVGSGPFRLIRLDDRGAVLRPAIQVGPPDEAAGNGATPLPTDALTTPAPTARPARALPYLSGIELRFFDTAAALAAAYEAGDLDAASGLPPGVATTLARPSPTRLLDYPSSTLTAVLLNLRPEHPEFRNADVRLGLLSALDRDAMVRDAFAGAAERAAGPIARASWAFDANAAVTIAHDIDAAAAALTRGGWTRSDGGWRAPGSTDPIVIEILTPNLPTNPELLDVARAVADGWQSIGVGTRVVELPPADYAGRLRGGDFEAAVADVNLGLDPDLYPLLASSQVTARGSNVIGLQDPALDELLGTARAAGAEAGRKAAYSEILSRWGTQQYFLPLLFQDEVVVARRTLEGPRIRQLGDPSDRFWDVLTWRLANGP